VLAFLGGYSVEMLFTAIRPLSPCSRRPISAHRTATKWRRRASASERSGKFGVEADPPDELPANGAASARTGEPSAALTTGRGKFEAIHLDGQ